MTVPGLPRSRFLRALYGTIFGCCLGAAAINAQSVGGGSIGGRLTDQTGAVLPGVTVMASSPALLLPTLTTVTEMDGTYRFPDLPAGLYRLTYGLSGFQSVVREDIRLNVGFAAKVDIALKVGVAETLTVSGQSPVVDVTTTATNNSFTQDTLRNIPTTRQMYQVLAMTPGVFTEDSKGRVDVGGSQTAVQLTYRNYGTSDQTTPDLEGIHFRSDTNQGAFFYDYGTLEEVQIKTVGASAETALPGTLWSGIVKSGGNAFHGSMFGGVENARLQGSNIDAGLIAKGAINGDKLVNLFDVSAELGGPIKHDKLWFYVAGRDQHRGSSINAFIQGAPPGVLPGPIGSPVEAVTALSSETGKGTYQLSPRFRLIGFFARSGKDMQYDSPARFVPAESQNTLYWFPRATKGELQATLNDKLLIDVMVANISYLATRQPQPGTDVPGNPSRMDLTNGWFAGPYAESASGGSENRARWESSGSLTFLPKRSFAGRHSLKAGYFIDRIRAGFTTINMASGNFTEVFNSGVPFELITYNTPVNSFQDRLTEYSGYVQDEWRMGTRLTANVGVRVDRYHSSVDPSCKPQGQFGNSGCYPGVDILTWTRPAPRVGLAYDLSGDGKTVWKGTYGFFNHLPGDHAFAGQFDANAPVNTTYRWHDLNGDGLYQPGEVNLSTTGPDYVSQTAAGTTLPNPSLKQPYTNEFSTSIERELVPNVSLRMLYVYKENGNLFQQVAVGRPYNVWDIPITRQDPGPDGVYGTADDRGTITLYDYEPAYKGSQFSSVQFVNRPSGRNDYFQTLEFTLNKRLSNHWSMLASFSALKNHRYVIGVPLSPNDNYFPIDLTWQRDAKVSASYMLPHDVSLAAFYTLQEGPPLQRTYTFRPTDTAGGQPFVSSTTISIPLEAFGAERLKNLNILSLSAAKGLRFSGSRRLDLSVTVYNALNGNTVTSQVVASGPTFGTVNNFLPPRLLKLSATFAF